MSHRSTFALAACSFLALASCAAPRERYEALRSLRDVPVTFSATIAPRTGEMPRAGVPAAPAPDWLKAPSVADRPAIEVCCRLVRVDVDVLRELLPAENRSAYGHVVSEKQVETIAKRLHAESAVEMITAPCLVIAEAGRGELSTRNQTSFVRGFGLQLVGGDLIGDPDVAVVNAGFSLEARGTSSGEAVELAIELRDAELVRPIGESVVHVPGSNLPVAVQVPITFDQELGATAKLAPGEMLVLGGLLDRDGRPLLACVTGKRVLPGAASNGVVAPAAALARQ